MQIVKMLRQSGSLNAGERACFPDEAAAVLIESGAAELAEVPAETPDAAAGEAQQEPLLTPENQRVEPKTDAKSKKK